MALMTFLGTKKTPNKGNNQSFEELLLSEFSSSLAETQSQIVLEHGVFDTLPFLFLGKQGSIGFLIEVHAQHLELTEASMAQRMVTKMEGGHEVQTQINILGKNKIRYEKIAREFLRAPEGETLSLSAFAREVLESLDE